MSKEKEGEAFICGIDGIINDDLWIVDSEATAHMTSKKSYFSSYEIFVFPKQVKVENNEQIWAYGSGNIKVKMMVNSE